AAGTPLRSGATAATPPLPRRPLAAAAPRPARGTTAPPSPPRTGRYARAAGTRQWGGADRTARAAPAAQQSCPSSRAPTRPAHPVPSPLRCVTVPSRSRGRRRTMRPAGRAPRARRGPNARAGDSPDRAAPSETDKPLPAPCETRSEEHTSELQSLRHLVCRLLLEKKKSTRVADRKLRAS